MIDSWRDIARLDQTRSTGFAHAGWAYDAYPDLPTLDAGRTIAVAEIEGPGVIKMINVPEIIIPDPALSRESRKAAGSRGIVLSVYFDDVDRPAVRAPIADFFADGCNGRSGHFSTPFVEKGPSTRNCFFPMPFAAGARVTLTNETPYDVMCYSFVEFDRLSRWDPSLGYFHATWRRFAFQLDQETDEHFFHIDGDGHLLGQAWSVVTDEPFFRAFHFLMEGNNEWRIDGEPDPRVNYLGTECAFGLHYGFRELFAGTFNGLNFVQAQDPAMFSVYRFWPSALLRFTKNLDLRLNWTAEFRSEKFREMISRYGYDPDAFAPSPRSADRSWVDYATTFYWYQREVGYEHDAMPVLEERTRDVLRQNTVGEGEAVRTPWDAR